MPQQLRILMVEDSENDAELVLRVLQKGGYALVCKRVETAPDFNAALAAGGWDAIIADYHLPIFSALEALRLAQASETDIPFIIVSGAIGEEVAVEAMKFGAHDYILKNSLARLLPAMERELRDAQVRHKRREAEEALLRLAAIVESSGDAIIGKTLDGTITDWNHAAEKLFGYTAKETIGQRVTMLMPPDRMEEEEEILARLRSGGAVDHFETVRVCKDGRRIEVSVTISPIRDRAGQLIGASKIARDITERRRAEITVIALSKLGQSLASVSTPEQAARVIGNIADELFGLDSFSLDLYSTETDKIQTVLNVDTIDGEKRDVPSTEGDGTPSGVARRVIKSGAELILRDPGSGMLPDSVPLGDAQRPSASLMFAPVRNQSRTIGILSVHSYTRKAFDQRSLQTLQTLADYCGGALERMRVREELRKKEEHFKKLAESSPVGIFECDETGQCTYVNARWTEISGLTWQQSVGSGWAQAIHPEDREETAEAWNQTVAENADWEHEYRILLPSGGVRWVRALGMPVLSSRGVPTGYVGTVEDITQGKMGEEELRTSREELRALAAHLQSVREEERKLITREIHDELGQALTGFKMDLAWMRNRLQSEEVAEIKQPILDKIKVMGGMIDTTANLVRKLCTELRPGILDDLGLTAAIEWQAREYQGRTGIICDVKLDLGELTVDPERSTALFRIFQEILTNVARHAQATRVDAELRFDGEEITMRVKDNGRGIQPGQIAGSKSLGLLGMRERAFILGGEVEISGAPGEGTTVQVRVPLPGLKAEAARSGTTITGAGVNGASARNKLKTKKKKAIL